MAMSELHMHRPVAPHACLQLGLVHEGGWGVEVNCSKAAGFMRYILVERSDWSGRIEEAVQALDAGVPASACQSCRSACSARAQMLHPYGLAVTVFIPDLCTTQKAHWRHQGAHWR